eukprot:scaffold22570_cov109-Cylindrotheca_fusiformis.AAC.4
MQFALDEGRSCEIVTHDLFDNTDSIQAHSEFKCSKKGMFAGGQLRALRSQLFEKDGCVHRECLTNFISTIIFNFSFHPSRERCLGKNPQDRAIKAEGGKTECEVYFLQATETHFK